MSNYNSLKATIDANIKQNGNQEITGQILNSVLNQMVNILGTGYQFAGVATIATDPGTPDAKVFYIANGKGKYEKFGGLEVTEDDVVVLYWDTAWHKVATGIASQAKLSELESNIGKKKYEESIQQNTIVTLNVVEGDLLDYDLTVEGTYGYIGFYDSDDNRLDYIGKGMTTPRTHYFGTVKIPNGYKYAKVMAGNVTINNLNKHGVDNVRLWNEDIELFAVGKQEKQIQFNDVGKRLTSTGTITPASEYSCSNYEPLDDVVGIELYCPLSMNSTPRTDTLSIAFYRSDSSETFIKEEKYEYGYNGYQFYKYNDIPYGANFFKVCGYGEGAYCRVFKQKSYDQLENINRDVDILYGFNYIVRNLNASVNNTVLFTSETIKAGQIIHYKFNATKEYGFIEILDSNGELIKRIGKISATQNEYEFDGDYKLPYDYYSVRTGSVGSIIIDYIRFESLQELSTKVEDSIVEIGELKDEIKEIMPSDSKPLVTMPTLQVCQKKYVLSTNDADAKSWDNAIVNYGAMIKISDDMFYFYYNSLGIDELPESDGVTWPERHLCFAYCRKLGDKLTRGFPDGVTAPIEGTNKLFESGVTNVSIVKVRDTDYPYRMVAIDAGESYISLYKSVDAINFVKIKNITTDYSGRTINCDSQSSAIVRGDIIKVYHRRWKAYTVNGITAACRVNGILYCDIDGNVINPTHIAIEEINLYNSAASPIGHDKDLLLPTKYSAPAVGGDSSCKISAYIVDGEKYKEIKVQDDTREGKTVFTEREKFFVVAPNMVITAPDPINGIYEDVRTCLMTARTTGHDSGIVANVKNGTLVDSLVLFRCMFDDFGTFR